VTPEQVIGFVINVYADLIVMWEKVNGHIERKLLVVHSEIVVDPRLIESFYFIEQDSADFLITQNVATESAGQTIVREMGENSKAYTVYFVDMKNYTD